MLKIPNRPNKLPVQMLETNRLNLHVLKSDKQKQIIKPAPSAPSKKTNLASDIIYNIRKSYEKILSIALRKIEFTVFNKIYKAANASKGKYTSIQEACAAHSRNLIGPVKIKNKKTGKLEEAYLTMRKINVYNPCTVNKCRYYFEKAINSEIQIRRTNTFQWRGTRDSIQLHQMLSQNSYVLEILNKKGIPVGVHFLDIAKESTEGKGLFSYARGEYAGIGAVLTEIKALTAAITGSKSVKTIGSWDSMPFHLKSGYKETPNAEKMIRGSHIYMPTENVYKIAQKYNKTQIWNNLESMIRPNIK